MVLTLISMAMMVVQIEVAMGLGLGKEPYATTPTPSLDPLADIVESARWILVPIGLMFVTLIANNFIEKAHLPVPEAIVTVVIGVVAGAVAWFSDSASLVRLYEVQFARQVFLFFIAPIIFATAYGMKSRHFFENITRLLSHAFLGTLISAFVVAAFVHYLPPLTGYPNTIPFIQCLTFGVLISSTDPVTTLAAFKPLNLVENGLAHLYFTVLGESILCDAVALTLFDGLSEVVKEDEACAGKCALGLAGGFLAAFFGSMAIGVAGGMLAALILKFGLLGAHEPDVDHYHFNVPEIGVALFAAYLPFLIASSIEGQSGIVAEMFAGIVMRHFAHFNLTETSRNLFLPTIELLASLSETYLFLLLGVGVFLNMRVEFAYIIILWGIVGCLVGRLLNVYPISSTINMISRSQRMTAKEMSVVWFAGLRGAISFICAMRFPIPHNGKDNNKDLFLSTTIIITLVSMVCLGWPTGVFLRCLNLKGPEAPLLSVVDEGEPEIQLSDSGSIPEHTRVVPLVTGEPKTNESRLMTAIGKPCAEACSKALNRIFMTPATTEERAADQLDDENREPLYSFATSGRPPLGGSRSFKSQPPSFVPGALLATQQPGDVDLTEYQSAGGRAKSYGSKSYGSKSYGSKSYGNKSYVRDDGAAAALPLHRQSSLPVGRRPYISQSFGTLCNP